MQRNNSEWSSVIGDAFAVFILFAVWLWQFESSKPGSMYHWIVGAIGFIGAVGLSIVAIFILVGIFTSRRDVSKRK
jgi:hypothetical protein